MQVLTHYMSKVEDIWTTETSKTGAEDMKKLLISTDLENCSGKAVGFDLERTFFCFKLIQSSYA